VDAAPNATPPPIEVRADRIDGALDLSDVTLEGRVDVRAGRFRLTAPRLRLRRDGTDVIAEGPARLSPCGCDDPPLALDVGRATLDDDGGVVMRDASLVLGGTRVLPLPWFALRSERQLGLVPPRLEWRGQDGALVGVGAHVPLWRGAGVDVEPAAYLSGGGEVVGTFHTDRSRLAARFDRKNGDLASARGAGSVSDVRWDVDAIRGDRARSGTLDLDGAARTFDRGAVSARVVGVEVGARMVAPRGASGGVFGPRVAVSRAWSSGGWLGAMAVDASTVAASASTTHVARLDATLSGVDRAGPVRMAIEGQGTAAGWITGDRSVLDAAGMVRPSVSVPLARRYGPTLHVVEPTLAVPIVGGRGAAPELGLAAASSSAGVVTGFAAAPGASIGTSVGDEAGYVHGALGVGALVADERRGMARGELAIELPWLRGRAEAAATGRDAGVATAGVIVGPRRGPQLDAAAEGRARVEPVAAQALAPGMPGPVVPWLATEGWSARVGGSVPIGAFRAGGGASWDVTARTRLAERVQLGYAHPCGCLAVGAVIGHRLGRTGPDAMLVLSLGP
jgi:hypothetical protein